MKTIFFALVRHLYWLMASKLCFVVWIVTEGYSLMFLCSRNISIRLFIHMHVPHSYFDYQKSQN